MGFSHESVHKQEVFARKTNMFLLVEKGTTPTIHKILYRKTRDLVAEAQEEVVGGTAAKIDSGSDGVRER